MKALLVYPEFPDTYWSFRHALKFDGKKSAFPPLGLMTIAALLPSSWECRLVDMNVSPLRDTDVQWADLVFASAMLVQKNSLLQVVNQSHAHGKKIAVGGPFVTTSVQEMPDADYIFLGESETTLPEFVRDLEQGNPQRIYQAAERPALSLTPIPKFHLADLRQYSTMSVQYSRGCPFQCEFCDIIEIYGRTPRTKSNEQMLAELTALWQLGWRGQVFIVDDNFIGNKRNVKKLLPALAEWSALHDHPFTFITEASVNLAEDEELLSGMKQAGFRHVFLGIETPVEESLIAAKKNQNTRRSLLEAVRKIQSYGMYVMAGFIVGFDNDPEDIFERQIKFIQESAIPLAMVGLLTALPDTQLWRRLKQEGRLLSESTGNNTDASLNFIPTMNPAKLLEGYQTILQTIYRSHEYYQRALIALDRVIQDVAPAEKTYLLRNFSALLRLLYTLGIRDQDRTEFWKYFREILLHHRKRFTDAMSLAAMGYHFRKLTSFQ